MESSIGEVVSNAIWSALWNLFVSTWYLWVLIFIGAVILELLSMYLKKKIGERKFAESKKWHEDKNIIYWLRGMRPSEFEEYIVELYSQLGYKTEKVGRAYDGGVDVIALKNGVTNYIQCKKFITSQVGVEQVRGFAGALVGKLANGNGIFITTNIFTTEAKKYAEGSMIELIDGDELVRLIKSIDMKNDFVKIEDEKSLECPECGNNLVKRRGSHGEFYGCDSYPKCRFTKNIE